LRAHECECVGERLYSRKLVKFLAKAYDIDRVLDLTSTADNDIDNNKHEYELDLFIDKHFCMCMHTFAFVKET